LQKFDQGGTYTLGAFGIAQYTITVPTFGTVKSNSISGAFSQITGFQLASAGQLNPTIQQAGSCQVTQATSGGASGSGGTVTDLDAGAITITGPAGSSLTNQALKQDANNSYAITNTEGVPVPGQTSFSLPAGNYTLSGAGGKDVGSFSTSLTLSSALSVTGGLPSTVNRGAGLTLNWTGGNASDLVEIIGSSATSTGSGTSLVVSSSTFVCLTTAGQKTFTVPSSILNQLPASTSGSLTVASGNIGNSFTAPLKAGGNIDAGAFSSFLGIGAGPAYQ
jgi:hypothetical protein